MHLGDMLAFDTGLSIGNYKASIMVQLDRDKISTAREIGIFLVD
jgi:hypothetical protein